MTSAERATAVSTGRVIRRAVLLAFLVLCALEWNANPSRELASATTSGANDRALSPAERAIVLTLSPVPAPPPDPTNRLADDARAAALGEAIFFDPRFSANGRVSCATCHDPARAFTDGVPLSIGLATGTRNAPTVLDAAHQRWLTWDGRADSLWAQALHPFRSPVEMGLTPEDVVQRVIDDPVLASAFREVTGRPAQDLRTNEAYANIGKCLAAYERTLKSPTSAFDLFVSALRRQDAAAMAAYPAEAIRGLRLFVGKAGCVRCHTGPLLSDGEFHLVGLPDTGTSSILDGARFAAIEVVQSDPFNAAGEFSDAPAGDQARLTTALVAHPELWAAVRTPSLRSAWATAPYMHTGQFGSLAEVVHFYNTLEGAIALEHHQERMLAPLRLSPAEEAELVAFLVSLASAGGS